MYGVTLNSIQQADYPPISFFPPPLPLPLRQTETLDLNDINLILEDIYVQSRPYLP